MSKKVSFDFDGTLTEKIVQDYAKSLIKKGFEVYVCTFRTKEYNDKLFKIVDKSTPANADLYLLTDRLGIKRENIIFTEDEADDKYPLGVMAMRNFDGYEGFEYKHMLVDVSYGIPFYPNMPED